MDSRTDAILALPLSAKNKIPEMAVRARGNDLQAIKAMAFFYQNKHEYGRALIFSLLAAMLIDNPADPFYKDCVAYIKDLNLKDTILPQLQPKDLIQLQHFARFCLMDLNGKTYISELKKQFPAYINSPLHYIFLAYHIEKNCPQEKKHFPFSDEQLKMVHDRLCESVHAFFRDGCISSYVIYVQLAENLYAKLRDNLFASELSQQVDLPSVTNYMSRISIGPVSCEVTQQEQKTYKLDMHSGPDDRSVSAYALEVYGNINALCALAIFYQIAERHDSAIVFSYLAAVLLGHEHSDYKRFYDYIKNCPIPIEKSDTKLLKIFILEALDTQYFQNTFGKYCKDLKLNIKNSLQILCSIIQYEMSLDQDRRAAQLPFHYQALLQIKGIVTTVLQQYYLNEKNMHASYVYDQANITLKNSITSARELFDAEMSNKAIPNQNNLLNPTSPPEKIAIIAQKAFNADVAAIVEMAHFYQDRQKKLGRSLIFTYFACSLLDKNHPQYKRHYNYIFLFESNSWLTNKKHSFIFLKQFLLDALNLSKRNFLECLDEAKGNLFILLINKLKEPALLHDGSSSPDQLEMAKHKIIESFNSFLTKDCGYTTDALIIAQEAIPIPAAVPTDTARIQRP